MGRGRNQVGRRAVSGAGKGWRTGVYLAVPAVLVVAVAVGASALMGRGTSAPSADGIAFPSYVSAAPARTRDAYAYAVLQPQVLRYIPCFCGCGEHSGHTSVHDCFVEYGHVNGGPVAFDPHGGGCQMCIDIVLDTKEFVAAGRTLQDARSYVVAQYGDIGPATDTPPIP